jgi:hypothetical protein
MKTSSKFDKLGVNEYFIFDEGPSSHYFANRVSKVTTALGIYSSGRNS